MLLRWLAPVARLILSQVDDNAAVPLLQDPVFVEPNDIARV